MAKKDREVKVEEPKRVLHTRIDTIRFKLKKTTLIGVDDALRKILKVKN